MRKGDDDEYERTDRENLPGVALLRFILRNNQCTGDDLRQ